MVLSILVTFTLQKVIMQGLETYTSQVYRDNSCFSNVILLELSLQMPIYIGMNGSMSLISGIIL